MSGERAARDDPGGDRPGAERAPRVLVLGTLLGQPMGGVRRHNAQLLPRAAALLAQRGGSLAVMEGLEPPAFRLGAGIEAIPTDAIASPFLARWMTEGPAARRALLRAWSGPIDLVHTAHLPVPRRLGVPFTITVHDLRHLEAGSASLARRAAAKVLLASALRRAALVLAVSETVRAELVERFRLDPGRVRVIPNAADHFEPESRRRTPSGEGGREEARILHVGHLERRKNLDVVLRALAADAGLPSLELAGAGKGWEEDRLRSLALRLGVSSRVRFLGPFDDRDLPDLYARAACAVLPSRIEGFGIPALEAQRAGVPLAIARAGALPEIAGEETPSFDPDDPADCAAAIRAAMTAPPEALERAAARAGRFTWDASARALVEAWGEAAK